jgi:hypothetical protein
MQEVSSGPVYLLSAESGPTLALEVHMNKRNGTAVIAALAVMGAFVAVSYADTIAAPGGTRGWTKLRGHEIRNPNLMMNRQWVGVLKQAVRGEMNRRFGLRGAGRIGKVEFKQVRFSRKNPYVTMGVAKVTPRIGMGAKTVFFGAQFPKIVNGRYPTTANVFRLRAPARLATRGGPPAPGVLFGRAR